MRALLSTLLAIASLSGCALLRPGLPQLRIAPAAITAPRVVEQRLRLQWREESRTLESVVDAQHDALTVIASTAGLRLFTLDYDGTHVRKGLGRGLPTGLSAKRVINDLLLIYAPESALAAAMPAPWRLDSDAHGRRLMHRGELVAEVSYASADPWSGRSVLQHKRLGYRLTIDSVIVP